MKRTAFLFALLSCAPIFAQEDPSEKRIEELKSKINHSKKGEKLKWMDSLSNFIAHDTAFASDSIVKKTVVYALELDSLGIATRQTGNLIYFQNNITGNPKEGNAIFKAYLETGKKTTDQRALYKYYLEGADSYYFIEDQEAAVAYYDMAGEAARLADYQKGVGVSKLYKGGSLGLMGKFSEASQILQKAATIFQQTKDTFNIISAKNSLSILYSQNAFFEEAKKERDDAIFLAKLIGSNEHLVSFYYNAATDARKQGAFKREIANLKQAIEANEKTRNLDVYIPTLYSNLISAYAYHDSIPLALVLLDKLESASEKYTTGTNRKYYVNALKHLAFAQEDFTTAVRYGNEHLTSKAGSTNYEEIVLAENFLANSYEKNGNREAAYSHFKNATILKDSITNVQKIKALSYYQTLYETEKRDLKIKAQESDIALLDARNKVKNQWLLFGGLGLLSIFSVIVLIRARNGARRRQKLTEGFSRDLINAQEEERTRVARELHDSVGQKLMLLTKQTKSIGNKKMESLAGDTLEELRSISRGLHPAILERLGVTAALKSMVNEVDASTTIFFTNEIDNIDDLLSKEASLHVYRIFQEVLSNMVKHADAKAASIIVERRDSSIQATITDNGKGFEFSEKLKESSSLGMKTLLERAKIIKSTLDISSKYNQGTKIELVIPV